MSGAASPGAPGRIRRRIAGWAAAAVALLTLNLSVTFHNVWPTLAIRPTAELSLDLVAATLGILVLRKWTGRVSTRALRGAAAVWVLLIAGRYVDVTTRALYGRDVNPYWDLRHVPSVGAMFATVAEPWQMLLFVGAALAAPIALYAAARWCLGQIGRAAAEPAGRRLLGAAAGVAAGLLVAEQAGWRPVDRLRFADPVAPAYAREAYELAYEMSGAGVAALGPPPVLRSDLARVAGADVFVVFMESYGAVSWERPAFVEALAGTRMQLAADVRESGRGVVSARVESTTFGGESWLAHISLLSGTEVREDRTNARLMAQERDTLVTVFQRGGYRALAIVPGLLVAWPEGAFYGFDEIYDYERLDYRGPPFGWWSVNDQYALARVDRLEIAPRDRSPRFVFFSTISTHAPFTPAPPYQAGLGARALGAALRRRRASPRLVRAARLAEPGAELRAGAPLRVRDGRRVPAAACRPGPGDDPGRRPPAAGAGERRGRLVGCAGACDRQPPGSARQASSAAVPGRARAGRNDGRPPGHAAAVAPRRVRRRRGCRREDGPLSSPPVEQANDKLKAMFTPALLLRIASASTPTCWSIGTESWLNRSC